MTLQAMDNYFDTSSTRKPPRFNKDNFALWKTRMELFISGADPQISYFLERGPYVPTQTVHAVPAANGQPEIPARELEKPLTEWNDEDRRLVSIDTKARSLIAMSLPNDVFHSVCHLRTIKEIWNTLCVQYEGTAFLMESRKIFLYESFILLKDETLSQTHQRFNCLLIDLKTIGIVYSNFEVITKFMEALLEYWETYTSCLTMSKDIKTLTVSDLYGILLNREQQKKLKKNLIRDTKDSKSTSLALVTDSVPPVSAPSSLVTITELESSDSDISESDSDFNESLAFLTRTFKCLPKRILLIKLLLPATTVKAKDTLLMIAGTRKIILLLLLLPLPLKNPKYQKLKDKYKKMKSLRKGKGLIAEDCDWDDVSSDESSDEEDTQVALMAITDRHITPFDLGRIPKSSRMASASSASLDTQLNNEATTIPIVAGRLPIVLEQYKIQWNPNNHLGLFDLPKGKEYLQPAKDFLLSCPLKTAFTINPKPSKRLLLQLWSTAMIAQETNSKGELQDVIKFQLDDEIVTFGIGTLRKVLDIKAKVKYHALPSKNKLIEFMDSIGFRWPDKEGVITKNPSTVKKIGLSGTYYYIWTTFGLCLTGKTGSTEQFPTTTQ
ncbi:LOW QUALITY PROTEIN: hypothetical protein OSB04_031170 [Centaurea solstitialis]|uniref:DUF4219 domain-containing protein n=1 Tax=Centaurea solstitialis TaxID=347529 RepID=A0AA38SSI4_9ASTR|nr:LOW QUALITY PROTEIN: hypothetical protein OSB04_031170 [Centaurea solstitialis]